jgi:hypothetical protein
MAAYVFQSFQQIDKECWYQITYTSLIENPLQAKFLINWWAGMGIILQSFEM